VIRRKIANFLADVVFGFVLFYVELTQWKSLYELAIDEKLEMLGKRIRWRIYKMMFIKEVRQMIPKDRVLGKLNTSLNLILKAFTLCDQNRFGESMEEISNAVTELCNARA